MTDEAASGEHIHFVTGRLAQQAVEALLPKLAAQVGFSYSVDVLPITVAALMSPDWIAQRVRVPDHTTRLLIPGYCDGDLTRLQEVAGVPVELGPKSLHRLPIYFSQSPPADIYGSHDIQIIAEINHCPRLRVEEILAQAQRLGEAGADIIDVGCIPGHVWSEVDVVVRELRDAGHRVSIDSMHSTEISAAVRSGAELVLSVNSSNREAAVDWGVEVIAIPDDPKTLQGLDETVDFLAKTGVPLRIDPILEPIGFGLASSLGRYLDIRRRYPDAEIMMGIGNLTELTDVDSAGINTLLLGFCQEVGIRSVLTTQVINWAQTSVRECDQARRLVYHAVNHKVLPKHLETSLLMLRDAALTAPQSNEIKKLATSIRDNNYRIYASEGEVHLVGRHLHLHDADPFTIMEQLQTAGPNGELPKNMDPSHAFYLGYEMCKAKTAITLGKQYDQDEALDWGLATVPETRHYLKKPRRGQQPRGDKHP